MVKGTVTFLETTLGVRAPDQIAAGTREKAMNRVSGIRKGRGRFQSTLRANAELTKRSELREKGERDAYR